MGGGHGGVVVFDDLFQQDGGFDRPGVVDLDAVGFEVPGFGQKRSGLALATTGVEEVARGMCRVRCPPPGRGATSRRDLATSGQLTTLVARLAAEQRPSLLDGFKRLRAARELGWSQLEVGLIEASAATALRAGTTLKPCC